MNGVIRVSVESSDFEKSLSHSHWWKALHWWLSHARASWAILTKAHLQLYTFHIRDNIHDNTLPLSDLCLSAEK